MSYLRMVMLPVVVGALFGVCGLPGGDRPALGDDFRVDNAVYRGDETEPSSQSTTIFRGGVVYDCLKSPAETVVFDSTAGRFTLLNLTHRARTELTTDDVAAFINRVQQMAAKSPDPRRKFLAEPKFQERFDEATGELLLSSPTSPWVSYRLVLSAEKSPTLVEQYHESCDWYARLNTLLSPGSPPPFGQLLVYAAMAQRQATASQVFKTLSTGKEPEQPPTTIRSAHRVVRPLERADLEQVARARESMSSFKLVSFDKYRKLEPR